MWVDEAYLEKLLDCIVHRSPPSDRLDDGGEIVIHQDDSRSFLGHFGACDSHGKANIGGFQCRRIIGAVASDRDRFAELPQMLDQFPLVLRTRSCQHLQSRDDLKDLLGTQLAEDRTFHGDPAGREDATFGCDGFCRHEVVPGDHANEDTGNLALPYRFGDARAQGILNPDDGQENHVLEDLIKICHLRIIWLDWSSPRRPSFVVAVQQGDGAQ